MWTQSLRYAAYVTAFSVMAGSVAVAQQQPARKPAAAQPKAAAPKPAAPKTQTATPKGAAPARPVDPNDAARKQEILNSPQWRRAMFELNEWLSAQVIYTPQQVAAIKNDLNNRVAKMTSTELQYMLADMDAKMKILDTQQAQDARAWLAQYLSVLSMKKREEVVAKMPNIVTMTAAQLNRELLQLQQKRAASQQAQQVYQQTQQQQVNLALQGSRAAVREYEKEADKSPQYYQGSQGHVGPRPFEGQVDTGPSMSFYSGTGGQFGIVYGGF